jgi:membrane-associated HD superfamily phosphohydrolase
MSANQNTNTDKLNTLSTILDLQQLEKQLFTNLETLSSNGDESSVAEQDQIVKRINDLSQTRINLFNSLRDLYQYAQDNVNENRTELVDKMVVAKVMETQLNNTKQMMNELEQVKDNKLRMVQINTYYGKQYQAQTDLMKLIIQICVVIIVFIFLSKRGIIPQGLFNLIMLFIVAIGGFLIFKKVSDISSRDKMDFDRYSAPSMDGKISTTYDYNTEFNDMDVKAWSICGEGTAFDNSLGQCIVKPVETFSMMNNEVIGYDGDLAGLSGPKEL